jgi:hypothetical protein
MFRKYWPYILWLIYFLFPLDLLPDTFWGVGWIDDIFLLILTYWIRKRQGEDFSVHEENPFFRTSGDGRRRSSENRKKAYEHERGTHKPQSKSKDPYRILDLDRSAGPEDIKRAYRLQANRYHPDKVSHLGKEFQSLAKEKFQDIQWAYEQLQRERGMI